MAFNPHSTYRGDGYIYGGFSNLGAGIADGIRGMRSRDDENAQLGSYLAAVGLPQEQIDSMDLAQRRGLAQAKMYNDAQAYKQAQMERMAAGTQGQQLANEGWKYGLDAARADQQSLANALQMLGTNISGYNSTPQYLRDPNYDPMAAPMQGALESGNMNTYLALQGLQGAQPPQFEFHDGPGGAVGWSYGKQGGVAMPKSAGSGAGGSEYASSYGKMLEDAQKLEAAGRTDDAQMLKNVVAAKAAMDDGIDERTLGLLNFTNPDLAQQIIKQRVIRANGGKAPEAEQPAATREDNVKRATSLLNLDQ